jgi:hypothetical protein
MIFRKKTLTAFLSFLIYQSIVFGFHSKGYQYLYPKPDALHVDPTAGLIIRLEQISPAQIGNLDEMITVDGQEGRHYTGSVKIAGDEKTVLFQPDHPFQPGETVQVLIAPMLRSTRQPAADPISYQFVVSASIVPAEEETGIQPLTKQNADNTPRKTQAAIMPNGVSVPSDFPRINITINNNPDDEYIFIDNRGGRGVPYNVIFDNTGSPVWYMRTPDERRDFKVQPNGWATMIIRYGYEEFGGSGQGFLALDNHYNPVKTFYATNGYYTDEHELQVLANSGYLIIGRKDETVDMSQYVSGGSQSARVLETCVQEFTANDELIFQWAAWDYLDIRDIEISDPRSNRMYFSHMNSIDIDYDNNIIVSNRELSEITKINRQTGDIIWRLGGAHNQFTFINDPLQGPRNQHAARVLGNNTYSMFDNGNGHNPPLTRAVKYQVDTNAMTATLIWEFHEAGKTSHYMGNAQQLPNGNMLINWAEGYLPKLTEVRPDGSKAFEMNWEDNYECYRVHRCTWNGMSEVPRLEAELYPNNLTLIFNKFGDPNVDYYKIYAGNSPHPATVLDTSGVTLKKLTNLENGPYWFRVTAVSKTGQESGYSNEESIYINFKEPGSNLVQNGDFTASKNDWTWELQGAGQANWAIENGEAHITISNGGSNDYDVQLRQSPVPLVRGDDYIFEFDAHADATRVIEAKVGQDQTPFTNYSKSTYFNLRRSSTHFTWEFEMEDPSDFNARVVFNMGNSGTAVYLDNISLRQKLEQWTYNASNTIPGTIQCEEYDFGGEGNAYHDDSSKSGDTDFRPEDNVDVEPTTDAGEGYNVGWTASGEWLEYTVDVEPGIYQILYRTASNPGGGVLRVLLDGEQLCEFNVPATGDWQNFVTLYKSDIWIDGGENRVLRLEIIEGNQNLNWIRFTKQNTGIEERQTLPDTYLLSQNYPNPFNPETQIAYQLPERCDVFIEVIDILGRHVSTLVDRSQEPGYYHAKWNGLNDRGVKEATGLYLISMKAGSFHAVRKLTLLR